MRRRSSASCLLRALLALACALPGGFLAAPLSAAGDEYGSARVSYLTGTSIYIEAGGEDGIQPGMILEVVRGGGTGAVVAHLRVTEVSSHRAVCVREGAGEEIVVGDVALYPRKTGVSVPAPGSGSALPSGAGPDSAPGSGGSGSAGGSSARASSLHGRIGVRWLQVKETEGEGGGFSQPALDLFLDNRQIAGGPFDVTVDVRSRRTYRTGATGDPQSSTAVYQMAAAWQQAGSPLRVTVGRQISPSLAAVNIFDGARGEFLARRWSLGLFGGTQPEDGDLGYSSAIREYGGYLEVRSKPLAQRRWAVTTGVVGSYADGNVNREFGFLQGLYTDRRWSIWAGQEIDLNRDWKEEYEDASVSLTSTYLNLRFRLGQTWTLNAGYDNRRNVRLYRDRVTPETEFDDEYRTGAWAGATWRFLRRFSAGFDVRTSAGGSAGSADGYSLHFSGDRLSSWGLDFRGRSTQYTNDRLEGWLHSLSAGIAPGRNWRVGLTGGLRDETSLFAPDLDRTLTWYGLDVDYSIGRHWLLWGSVERSQGSADASDQIYLSVSYRW